ncbi:MAG: hypothetical protein H7257_00335 [Taibaiella sp.]|nr:hypothetical protein [Taibaiella sp.]
MKKMIIALMVLGFGNYSAEAKKKCVCKNDTKQTTKYTSHTTGKIKKANIQNYHVCKDFCGYHICGETPTVYNTTPQSCAAALNNATARGNNDELYNYIALNRPSQDYTVEASDNSTNNSLLAPHSQSYPAAFTIQNAGSFEGYYPNKGKIVVGGDNATAPYAGEASPQYDGPKKNKVRNLKVNSPEQNSGNPDISLPPSNGEIKR